MTEWGQQAPVAGQGQRAGAAEWEQQSPASTEKLVVAVLRRQVVLPQLHAISWLIVE